MREADGGIDVYLRNAVGCGTGNAFVAYGIVDVSMGYQGNQLFGTVTSLFPQRRWCRYLISQVADALVWKGSLSLRAVSFQPGPVGF